MSYATCVHLSVVVRILPLVCPKNQARVEVNQSYAKNGIVRFLLPWRSAVLRCCTLHAELSETACEQVLPCPRLMFFQRIDEETNRVTRGSYPFATTYAGLVHVHCFVLFTRLYIAFTSLHHAMIRKHVQAPTVFKLRYQTVKKYRHSSNRSEYGGSHLYSAPSEFCGIYMTKKI